MHEKIGQLKMDKWQEEWAYNKYWVKLIFYYKKQEEDVLLFYAIKNLLTAYHMDKSSTG